MKKIVFASIAMALTTPALAQPEKVIVIDNRSEQCVVGSRIAEGNRRRAEIKVTRLVRQFKADGYAVRVIRLEAGDRVDASSLGNSDLLVRTDC